MAHPALHPHPEDLLTTTLSPSLDPYLCPQICERLTSGPQRGLFRNPLGEGLPQRATRQRELPNVLMSLNAEGPCWPQVLLPHI